MNNLQSLNKSLIESCLWLSALVAAYLASFYATVSIPELFVSLPFFVVLYFLFFSIGKNEIVDFFRKKVVGDVRAQIVFPAMLWLTFAIYLLINGHSPFNDLLSLFPFFLFFPVLAFSSVRSSEKINWFDFFVFVSFLLPTTLVNIQPKGDMPFHGGSFDSVYRIIIMLVAVYAFSIVRGVDGVGFYPEISLKKLWTAVWVWLLFYGVVFLIGVSVDFIRFVGHQKNTVELAQKILLVLITGFLHTAVFEELFFRGLLQNMLAKRIAQGNSSKTFLISAFVILFPLAVVVGYTLKGGMQWFPAFVTVLIFSAAWLFEKRQVSGIGTYTSLAITSVLFGLVHYHAASIVYIGFACIAGWGYGYVYIKTKNVFYCALTHALVNASALIFGLSLVK